jgi:hypothetical protein
MKRISCLTVAMVLATVALAAEHQNPFVELDAKITESLTSDKWNYASKTFVRVLWEDYRKAHLNPVKETSFRGVFGKMPDVEKFQDYLGAFGRGADATRPFLEITEDKDGRFHVELEGHTIPAVQRSKTVVFTTGDVVYSSMPTLADKPYCTLEIYMVIRTEGKFFFGSPSMPPDKWMPLSKLRKD